MPTATTATPDKPSPWILSRSGDLSLFLGLPILLFVAFRLASQVYTPVELFVLVFGAAAIGHHLPGFMKAYGDREVFLRHRKVLLATPPLLFAGIFLMTRLGSDAFSTLIVVWSLWHGYMQAYGLLRLYDSRAGGFSTTNAWMDRGFAATVYWTVAIFWRQDATYAILNALNRTGMPIIPLHMYQVAANGISVLFAIVCISYFGYHAWMAKQGKPFSRVKLAYAGSLMAFFYALFALKLSSPIFALLATEFYHDVQYFAVAYASNRQAVRAGRGRGRAIQTMFKGTTGWACIYVAAIVVYGCLDHVNTAVAPDQFPLAASLLLSFLSTSSILHYYTDGFIWRRSPPPVTGSVSLLTRIKKGGPKLWQPMAAAVLLAAFIYSSRHSARLNDMTSAQSLAALLPDSKNAQIDLGVVLREHGDMPASQAAFERALAIDPDSVPAHVGLGRVLYREKSLVGAENHFRRAVLLNPRLQPKIQKLREVLVHGLNEADVAELD